MYVSNDDAFPLNGSPATPAAVPTPEDSAQRMLDAWLAGAMYFIRSPDCRAAWLRSLNELRPFVDAIPNDDLTKAGISAVSAAILAGLNEFSTKILNAVRAAREEEHGR